LYSRNYNAFPTSSLGTVSREPPPIPRFRLWPRTSTLRNLLSYQQNTHCANLPQNFVRFWFT